MDKKKLSEADICLKFITPGLVGCGWDLHEQIFQNFTLKAGRMVVRGQRAARDRRTIRFADYMLCHRPGLPIAVIEAKDNNHSLNDGMAQAPVQRKAAWLRWDFPSVTRNCQIFPRINKPSKVKTAGNGHALMPTARFRAASKRRRFGGP